MTTVSAQISDKLYETLSEVAKELKVSNAFLISEAISSYVEEMKEDIEDTNEALRILSMNNPSYPLEEVIKRLGLKYDLED